jgi:predicted nucleic acid-binding protein
MMTPRIYIDTTIPSAYYNSRSAPEMVAQREQTRRWWHSAVQTAELFSSVAMLEELERGTSRHVAHRMELVASLDLLDIDQRVMEIADIYIRRKVMPAAPRGDAMHLAVASCYECDFLVTWDYRHLANANKLNHIRVLNTQLGLFIPSLVTPQQLRGADEEDRTPRSLA